MSENHVDSRKEEEERKRERKRERERKKKKRIEQLVITTLYFNACTFIFRTLILI